MREATKARTVMESIKMIQLYGTTLQNEGRNQKNLSKSRSLCSNKRNQKVLIERKENQARMGQQRSKGC